MIGKVGRDGFGQFLVELRATYAVVIDGRRGRVLRELGGLLPPDAEPAGDADGAERRELVQQLLGSLSPQDRVTLELHIVEELPAEQIARVLGLPNAKAVYNRVHRALAVLRARLALGGLQRHDV